MLRTVFIILSIYCISLQEMVAQSISSLSLDEKIGQLFMISVYSNKDKATEESYIRLISKYHLGGVIFFQGNAYHQVQLIKRMQAVSKIPLLVGLDAEHGAGWRLKGSMTFPQMQTLGAIRNDSLIQAAAATIARHCSYVGVHINFAPDADVNNNALNPIIGTRSFGENPQNVGNKAIAYMNGSLEEGIIAVGKHYPGHGNTKTDSHKSLPVITDNIEQLQKTELTPFKMLIDAGCPAIMTGHLSVPAMDSSGISASLSPTIVKTWLTDSFLFDGLKITDALNMKGASASFPNGETEVRALIADNDILLFPEDVEKAISAIKTAVLEGRISEQAINRHVQKIIRIKNVIFGDTGFVPSSLETDSIALYQKMHTQQDSALRETLYKKALTLIQNRNHLIPLKRLDTLRIAALYYDMPVQTDMQKMFEKYAKVTAITSIGNTNSSLYNRLKDYNCVIIINGAATNKKDSQYGFSGALAQLLETITDEKYVIFCHPSSPYGIAQYEGRGINSILLSYENTTESRIAIAQGIFGGIDIDGILPISISDKFKEGTSIQTKKCRLGYERVQPFTHNINIKNLNKIDSICNAAIKEKATPGCEVLIAKDGYIIYDKSFGFHTYDKSVYDKPSDIYDLASVTKVTATLPIIMELCSEGKIELNDKASKYYTQFLGSDKEDIQIKQLLSHSSGLPASIPFISTAIDRNSITGNLFTTKYDSKHTKKITDKLYINPNYKYRDSTISNTAKDGYIKRSEHLYVHPCYIDSCFKMIDNCPINPKSQYTYSDLNFILLGNIAENCTGTKLNELCAKLYKRVGATETGFIIDKNINDKKTIPTAIDNVYGRGSIQNTVHDPNAAILGGVAGHAGLFSTANDLAKIMELYLNYGEYGGEQIIDSTTVKKFISQNEYNRRGLGFDKPERDSHKASPTSNLVPFSSFGHMGFTGTMVWSDPENHLTYIFLSNRTYPDEYNLKLSRDSIRTKIQDIIYKSIEK